MNSELVEAFPTDFAERGRFRVWDVAWNPIGFSDDPQYLGQQPVRFPLDATPIECFLGGYIRAAAIRGLGE